MDIAILGGGVAGISTAIALKQKDFNVQVYERRDGPTEIGAGIVCWPNATFVLQALGLLPAIEEVSSIPKQMKRISHLGEDLGSLDIGKLDKVMGLSSRAILRKDLQTVMLAHLSKLGVEVIYSHNVDQIQAMPDGRAKVLFDNGHVIQPEIIIGAEGRMNSIARAYVNGKNKPVYQGFINWIGTYQGETEMFADMSVKDYWGIGQRFGIVPISNTEAYWAAGIAAPQIGLDDYREYKNEIQSIFDPWPDPISTIVADTVSSRINKIYVHDHDPIDTWHKDNVLLIGDAAHSPLPTSGQGACQALEDAWHLANYLSKDAKDLDSLFAEFTAFRYPKTSSITMAARQFASSLFNTSAKYCLERNRNSQATDYDAVVGAMAGGWSSGLPLVKRDRLN